MNRHRILVVPSRYNEPFGIVILEGWSALFLERTLDADPAVSGLGPGLFAAAMATGRLLSQRVEGPGVVARMVFAGVAAAAGLLVAVTATHAAVALLGFVLAGAGLALPLTALNDAFRAVYNDGLPLAATWPQLLILLAWMLVSFFAALKLFRWQ